MVTNQETDQETSQETNQETNQETIRERKASYESSLKNDRETDSRMQILNAIRENPSVTQKKLEAMTGLSRSGVRYIMQQLQREGILQRVGSTKKGKWLLNEND